MLTKLTPEQEALLPKIREEWVKIGLDTAPLSRARVREAIDSTYWNGGLTPPKILILLNSPLAGFIACLLLQRSQVQSQVQSQVGSQVGSQVLSQVESQVESQVGSQVGSQVLSQVGSQVGSQDTIWPNFYGQHEAGWLSFYYTMGKLGVNAAPMGGLFDLAQNAGWCWLFRDIAIITAKPNKISLDDQGRLHSTKAHAITYPDGYGLWFYHGVAVPSWLIEHPEKLSPELIMKEDNVEVRRVMLEIYGQSKFLVDSKANLLNEDEYGKLYSVNFIGSDGRNTDEPLVMVRVREPIVEGHTVCWQHGDRLEKNYPTLKWKNYYVRVPPTVRTAKEAVAWTFNEPTNLYSCDQES